MRVNPNYEFEINVSRECYKVKSDSKACLSKAGSEAIGMSKMSFQKLMVTPAEFLGLAISGHTFCNLFEYDPSKKYWIKTNTGTFPCYPEYRKGANKGDMKLSFKSDRFFKGSYLIFVDIDDTKYTDIGEYIGTLQLKPTIVHPTYSDNIEKNGKVSRRFRLVYVFSSLLSIDDFVLVSQAIHEHVALCTGEEVEDCCGTRPSQYMNGVYGNTETYMTDIIYDLVDFPRFETYSPPTIADETDTDGKIKFDVKMLECMERGSYQEITHKYSWLGYTYRTERDNDWIQSESCSAQYHMTDDEYLQIWFPNTKVLDGQHRRNKLFRNACLRLLMNPRLTPDQMLYNLYMDSQRFFDNSDGVLTIDLLQRKVINAFKKMEAGELEEICKLEIAYWKMNRPKFIVKGHHLLNTQSAVNYIGKELRYNELDLLYDPTKSVAENMNYGLGVSQATLYRYCKDRQLDTTPREMPTQAEMREDARNEKEKKIELFRNLYNPDLTENENLNNLKTHGVDISKQTMRRWKNKYVTIRPVVSMQNLSISSIDYAPQVSTQSASTTFGQMEEKPFDFDLNVQLPSFIRGWNFT